MAPSSLVIWRLTDGKPGHMQQTLGLVRALARLTPCEVIDIDIVEQQVGLLDALLGRFRPGLAKRRPDLVVGAGHATHMALLAARRTTGAPIVALMKPSLPLALFDLVIAPAHDGLEEGPRVINSLGALNPMQRAEKKPDSLLFLVGGPSKHVHWDDATVARQVAAVVEKLPPGTAWRIADSRRTPDSLRADLQQCYGERFQSFADCPPGWLAERLAATETVWVSEDSVSMVYESLTAGCRVGLLQIEADPTSRVARGVEKLIAEKLVTPFVEWEQQGALRPAASFDEAARVAPLVLARLRPPADQETAR